MGRNYRTACSPSIVRYSLVYLLSFRLSNAVHPRSEILAVISRHEFGKQIRISSKTNDNTSVSSITGSEGLSSSYLYRRYMFVRHGSSSSILEARQIC